MVRLPLGAARWTAGSWHPWIFGPTRQLGAAVVCPAGHAFAIGGGQPFGSVHHITADGTVLPSVVCPRCSWHVMMRLDNWECAVGL